MRETILDKLRRWWRGKQTRGRMKIRRQLWERVGIREEASDQANLIVEAEGVKIRQILERDADRREQELRDWALETLRREIDRAKEDMRAELRSEIRDCFGMDEPKRERPGVSGLSEHH